ncbi:hypothetical protein K6Q96_06940 [Grimontia kaedaensis]|uniref:DUF4376 domain-containing protein n=1 Tax=Grimontia kaedaensis TaxID=2872157 RepID=A0ABY4WXJ5_9GAMM|nr:hypothetical protein [Grimontia kaedaensis]USH03723.1 hypothetical protein K6Q96_06940 [Grimontia kaedaensis]
MIELSSGEILTKLPDGNLDFESKAIELLDDAATEETILAKAAELESQYLEERSFLAMTQMIEEQVYFHYSQKQQSQDEKWNSRFSAKIRAMGVTDIDTTIVDTGSRVYASLPLFDEEVSAVFAALPTEVQSNEPDYLHYMLEKLIMIAVKTEWAENVIAEGKLARAELREPVWPPFPRFM